ncbi:hypothetical protein, partial [Microbacterium testaceum]|uniref:hypothetical protein n=1 Tax=Microbacterium testaceum TaxID=2033 RepID=UPI0019D3FADE
PEPRRTHRAAPARDRSSTLRRRGMSGRKSDETAGAFAEDEAEAVGTAEMDADNPVEEDMIEAVDPGGSPD